MSTTKQRARRRKKRASKSLSPEPELLRSELAFSDESTGVDSEENVIRGYVVAQRGQFKSQGRGQFNLESLQEIVRLGNENPRGLKSRFGHPNESNDGLGKHLGRARDFRLLENREVRADLYLNETSLEEPPEGGRPLGEYTMHLAETDPGALSSSLVLTAEKLEIDGQPPVWMPTQLLASDVVDTGDAVDDFLAPEMLEDLPTGHVYKATKLIDQFFDGLSRDVVEARLRAFCDKYLDHRYGVVEEPDQLEEGENLMSSENQADPRIEALETKVDGVVDAVGKLTEALTAQQEASQKQAATEERSRKITALCAQCGVDAKQASEWIADECLTVDDVKDKLLTLKFEQNTPADPELPSNQASEDLELSREYDEFEHDHRMLGITKEKFVEVRKKEKAGATLGEWQMESQLYPTPIGSK